MATFLLQALLVFALVFAILICNATAGFASGLARGLAFATTAVLCALAKVTGFNGINVFHCVSSVIFQRFIGNIIPLRAQKVNSSFGFLMKILSFSLTKFRAVVIIKVYFWLCEEASE